MPMFTADRSKVEEGFRLVLEGLGLNLADPHLQDTPRRAARAWYHEICVGVTGPAPKLTLFPQEGPAQMVLLRNIPVKSVCAHHLLPFIGTAAVAYIPGNGEILGLSKLSRIVDYHARRPQVQENLTNHIADHVWRLIRPDWAENFPEDLTDVAAGGVGVVVRANHLCMELRGVQHSGDMVTSSLRGVFEEGAVREEFLSLAQEK